MRFRDTVLAVHAGFTVDSSVTSVTGLEIVDLPEVPLAATAIHQGDMATVDVDTYGPILDWVSEHGFLAEPTDDTLAAARTAWLDARADYGLTEAFRFYGGPIDNETDGTEGLINAWPMDEAYVEGDEDAGIINNPADYPTIDATVLAELNEAGGETNISAPGGNGESSRRNLPCRRPIDRGGVRRDGLPRCGSASRFVRGQERPPTPTDDRPRHRPHGRSRRCPRRP